MRPCSWSSASAANCSARTRARRTESPHPQVDDVERIEAEPSQIVVDGLFELHRRASVEPATGLVATSPDLGHDAHVLRIRVQGFLDDLVRDERAVEITGVDVGDAQSDRLAQHCDGGVPVGRWAEDARPGQLHRAIPHPGHRQVRGHPVRPAGKGLVRHACLLSSRRHARPLRSVTTAPHVHSPKTQVCGRANSAASGGPHEPRA